MLGITDAYSGEQNFQTARNLFLSAQLSYKINLLRTLKGNTEIILHMLPFSSFIEI